MILADLQRYVRAQERASMQELSDRLGADAEALRGMLDLLIAKGRIRRVGSPAVCGGCALCPPALLEVYAWAEGTPREPAAPAASCSRPSPARRAGEPDGAPGPLRRHLRARRR